MPTAAVDGLAEPEDVGEPSGEGVELDVPGGDRATDTDGVADAVRPCEAESDCVGDDGGAADGVRPRVTVWLGVVDGDDDAEEDGVEEAGGPSVPDGEPLPL